MMWIMTTRRTRFLTKQKPPGFAGRFSSFSQLRFAVAEA
jgi:hypothetical protein